MEIRTTMYGKVIKILLLGAFFLTCQQKTVILEDTSGYIAFHRMPEAGHIVDFNIWLINTKTKEEIRITRDLGHWEFYPVWMSDSELLCLIEPQEKTMTEKNIVYVNFNTGKMQLLDFWTWRDCPRSDKISIDSSNNLYYATYIPREGLNAIYRISLNEKRPKPIEILSPANIRQFGLAEVSSPIISPDGTKLLLVACDTAKYRGLHNKEVKKYYYDIYLYDFDTYYKIEGLKRLTHSDYDNDHPVWIGNDSIVFASNRNGNWDLYLANKTGEILKNLTSTENIDESTGWEAIAVAPDRNHIAYSRYNEESKKSEIWIMDLKTQKTWFLTEGSAPDWSPAR